MEVTGRGEAIVCPAALTSAADGALAALRAIAPSSALPTCGVGLLGERARLLGLSRQGEISANGSCRLLRAGDGYVALNLARVDDWAGLPALFQEPTSSWEDVARMATDRSVAELVERGIVLGMAIAASGEGDVPALPFTIERHSPPHRPSGAMPLVVDFSSLWAGPLAGSLLAKAGARVIKVESKSRPDGARYGHTGFFSLLHAGKEEMAFDFGDARDLTRLRDLVASADMVIEASRPRALAQLGLSAAELAARGGVWLSITAHGRWGDAGERIGFGDDAAVAGGLAEAMTQAWGEPLFAGDAIADPLTGLTAAFVGLAAWQAGGGCIAALAMRDVVAHARSLYTAGAEECWHWQQLAMADKAPLYPLRR